DGVAFAGVEIVDDVRRRIDLAEPERVPTAIAGEAVGSLEAPDVVGAVVPDQDVVAGVPLDEQLQRARVADVEGLEPVRQRDVLRRSADQRAEAVIKKNVIRRKFGEPPGPLAAFEAELD